MTQRSMTEVEQRLSSNLREYFGVEDNKKLGKIAALCRSHTKEVLVSLQKRFQKEGMSFSAEVVEKELATLGDK